MIKQILNLADKIPVLDRNEIVISLNDKTGNVVLNQQKTSKGTEPERDVYKKIMDRMITEESNPTIQRLIRFKFRNCTDPNLEFKQFRVLDLYELVNDAKRIEGHREKIAQYAIDTEYCYNTLFCMGIDPDMYFDPKKSKCCEILKNFEEQGVEFLYDTKYDIGQIDYHKGIRYVTSVILNRHEEEILSKISLDIKNNPVEFLKALKNLKKSSSVSVNQYVVDKLIAQAEVWNVMQENPKLKDFPFKDIWRFCIDIEFQKYGAYIFENEPGYIIATLKALCFGLQLKKPNHLDYIEINRKCGESVLEGYGAYYLGTKIRHGVDMISFGIYGFSTMDREGLQDLEERNRMPDAPWYYEISSDKAFARVFLESRSAWKHLREMKFLFGEHGKKISAAKNEGERLIAHIWLSRELSLQHHLQDGNGRTAQILFLSLLANDPELPMMLLDTNPNLDTNGPVAFIKRVLQGMKNFSRTCGRDEDPLSYEEVDKMTGVSEKRLWSYYHPTQEERQAFLNQHSQEEFEIELKKYNETIIPSEKRLWFFDYRTAKMKQTIIKVLSYFLVVPSVAFIFYYLFNFIK